MTAIILAILAIAAVVYLYFDIRKFYKLNGKQNLQRDLDYSVYKKTIANTLIEHEKKANAAYTNALNSLSGITNMTAAIQRNNEAALTEAFKSPHLKNSEKYQNILRILSQNLTNRYLKITNIKDTANSVNIIIDFGEWFIDKEKTTIRSAGELSKLINLDEINRLLTL